MLLTLLASLLLVQGPDAPRFAGFPEQDALAYELTLDVQPAEKRLVGSVTYRFAATTALSRIRLHARRGPDWKVDFKSVDGKVLATDWKEDEVTVRLPQTALAGTEVVFRAELSGTPPDGFFFKESRYGDALAFTDHYSIRARGWLPCEDHPGDRARFVVKLTYPEGNQAVASGVPPADSAVEAAPAGRDLLWCETKSDIPPYMLAIVVGPYSRVPEGGDPRLQPHLIYEEDLENAREALTHHASWIRILEETFGPYAFGKYTVVQCPTRWGGFEAPGNVQLSERIFDRSSRGVGILAHELVHMWFGDAVGYAEWHEVWLSEGFASYFGPWLHARTGGPEFVESLKEMRRRWRRSPEGTTKTIRWDGFEHPDQALNANTYPKGAWILHMLRGELGDEAFFETIARFYRENRGRSVITTDFTESVARSTGRDLGWFFDQWLDRLDCPRLRVEAAGEKIVVEQLQDAELFRFRLRLGWSDETGAHLERVFEISKRRTELPAGGVVRELVIDPDVELLFRAG